MKLIAQLISAIVLAMTTGCNRESVSAHKPDAVSRKPNTAATAKVPQSWGGAARTAEWERAFKAQQKQYEKVEALAKEVSRACAGTNGEEAVDALLAKVSDVLDAFESSSDHGYAITERTGLVSPFVRDVECYWVRRRFRSGETPPENLLNEVRLFHSLATKTVDLLQKKVGNSYETVSLELNAVGTLKWLAHNFERVGWKEEKKYVDNMVDKWLGTRYDVMEGNPLKDACENVEFYAAKDPNRDKLPAPIYSRTKNMYVDKARWVVGRLPKWFAAWAEEMERKDASVRGQSKNGDEAYGSSR